VKCTVLRGNEVEVTVTEGFPRGGVFADANRREALELGECVDEVAVGDVGVEVADIERRRSGGDRRMNRHG